MKNTKTQKHKNTCKFVFVTFSICILLSLSSITASAVDADFKVSIDSVTPLDIGGTVCPADVIINVTITKISGSELSCIGPVLGTIYDNGALLPTVDTQNISNMCLTLNNDSESFTITVSNISAGSHTFLFSMTAIGFTDTDPANNNATNNITLCPGQKPDLTVTAVRTFYGTTPLMEELNYTTCPMYVTIKADIQNLGVVDASNVNVSFYVDSTLIGSSIENVPANGLITAGDLGNIIWYLT